MAINASDISQYYGKQVSVTLSSGLIVDCVLTDSLPIKGKAGVMAYVPEHGVHIWCPLEDFQAKVVDNPITTSDRRLRMIRHHNINVVLDVGANVGQYGSSLRVSGYDGSIISFEPLREAFELLKVKSDKDPKWKAVHMALGDRDTDTDIHISNNSYSSSVLSMLPRHLASAPESVVIGSERIVMRRLESVAQQFINAGDRILLKIDTQGYEHFVIEGIGRIINNVQLIECELSLFPLYDGQKLFNEMIEILRKHGFVAVDFTRGFFESETGYCLQVDGIFANSNAL
jgi:FkbM family methyltransferase